MGQRKNSSRSSGYSGPGRRTSIGLPASGLPNRPGPISYSSPVRQTSRPSRRLCWGSGNTRNNYLASEGQSPTRRCGPEAYMWGEQSCGGSYSSSSLMSNSSCNGSDGGSSSSGSGTKSKTNNSKKSVARPSNPLRYKTELCRSYEESGDCRFGSSCTFAHGLRELRAVLRHPRYKTDLCRTYHGSGYCQYGARCHFVHDPEEAAGVSAMRGHRLRSRQDGTNLAMLALAGDSGLSSPTVGDAFLANLRRLQTFDAVQRSCELLDSSGSTDKLESIESGSPSSDSLSIDMLTLGHDNISSMLSMSQPPEVNLLETPPDNLIDSSLLEYNNVKLANGGSFCKSGLFPKSAPQASNWWGSDNILTPSSSPDFVALPTPTGMSDLARRGKLSFQTKSIIGNPMEVSRSLLLPSIAELIHMP